MGVVGIIKLIAFLLPFAEEAGINIIESIQRMKDGETADDLIKELKEKRDDMPELDFGKSS
jgi:hypothetical protein